MLSVRAECITVRDIISYAECAGSEMRTGAAVVFYSARDHAKSAKPAETASRAGAAALRPRPSFTAPFLGCADAVPLFATTRTLFGVVPSIIGPHHQYCPLHAPSHGLRSPVKLAPHVFATSASARGPIAGNALRMAEYAPCAQDVHACCTFFCPQLASWRTSMVVARLRKDEAVSVEGIAWPMASPIAPLSAFRLSFMHKSSEEVLHASQ
jgi:hypothetical protein